MSRHNMWIPDELYAPLQAAAAKAGADEGKPISVSAWVRRTLEAELDRPTQRNVGVVHESFGPGTAGK